MEEMRNTAKKWQICDGFVLKMIAIITMTFDHIAVIASSYGLTGSEYDFMRILGRFALPLFAFLIVEGVLNTKSFLKYLLRLSISAVIVSIGLILLTNIKNIGYVDARYFGNIFLDLLMGALTIYFLRQEKYRKLLALIPLAFVVLSFVASHIEETQDIRIYWFPYFLRTQFGLMGYAFIIGFYCSYLLKDVFLEWYSNQSGILLDNLKNNDFERTVTNIISVVILFVLAATFHILKDQIAISYLDIQLYSLISGAFILLYNGKRGYNSKCFQYTGYCYYPLHLILIAVIFHLINL